MTQLFDVCVIPEGEMFLIDVIGVGVTQAHSLEEVAVMARDLIAIMLDLKSDDVALNVIDSVQPRNFVSADERMALLEALPGINEL